MVKLHLFSGFENRQLGITDDMELGHLYSDSENLMELKKAGAMVEMKPYWMQSGEETGIWHFDLWGKPLEKAKRLFPIVTDTELARDMEMLRSGHKATHR